MTIAAQCNHDWRYGLRDSENGSYRRCQKCRYAESTEPAVAPTPVERKTDLQRIQGSYSSGSQSAVAPAESQGRPAPTQIAAKRYYDRQKEQIAAESQGVERAQPVEPQEFVGYRKQIAPNVEMITFSHGRRRSAQPVEGPRETKCKWCGEKISYRMVTFEYVPDRMEWVHDRGSSVDCIHHVADPINEPTCGICGVCESWHPRTGCDKWTPVAAPVEGVERVTDDAPARVEPRCKHGVWAGDHCYQCGPVESNTAAQPAKHTDDRAETIPGLEFDRHRDKLTPYWQKKVRDFRVEIAEQDDELAAAETRIEVLEAALRMVIEHVNRLPKGHYSPWLTWWAKEYAALAAPSGEKEKV